MTKKITVIVEKTYNGFSAYFDNYPIFTTGKNMSELIDNAFESFRLYFETENIENIKFDFKKIF